MSGNHGLRGTVRRRHGGVFLRGVAMGLCRRRVFLGFVVLAEHIVMRGLQVMMGGGMVMRGGVYVMFASRLGRGHGHDGVPSVMEGVRRSVLGHQRYGMPVCLGRRPYPKLPPCRAGSEITRRALLFRAGQAEQRLRSFRSCPVSAVPG
jgi:hypothetical protein